VGVHFHTLEDIERRLTELERMVRHLYEHGRIEPPPPPEPPGPSDQVMAYLAEGRKIEAIEQLRRETGLGLAEAKRAVDEIEGPTAHG
jgi:hypothetical protein